MFFAKKKASHLTQPALASFICFLFLVFCQ